ncbi:carbohydrate ABC transporter permease [Gracilinema caldarium]|uniref:sn-glycerol-3-phosphate transport system permease protein UgpE n=1 Tax=Gracilinema caldarium (strain ATCC 51460 / DSM 7334 / H1) TaxID=744872 RepID=F8EWS9_GRAC1|nr:carbohydrate ABC transporter permease [Gracilinema caldarium]AEJ18315.1 ABC-type transporter, integral membrane subunit [Gracilinema caldarium DSM 7334]
MTMSANRKFLFKFAFYVVGTLLVASWLIPIAIAFFTSLKSMDELMASPRMWAPPKKLVFSNFAEVWAKVGMARYVVNTLIITIPSVIGALLVSSLGAFALAFYKFRLNKTVLIIFITGMLIPFQMLLIPVYRFSDTTGLINTYPGIILFHIAFQLGFCTFFLRNFMKQIPFSLIEAPRIDGANDFYIYRKIVLPLSVSSMAALGVLEFTWIWNDLLWSLILLQIDRLKPVTLGLANMQGEFISNYNMIAAGSIIAAAAPLVIFLFFQRYFIAGLTVGAEKG